MTEKRNLKKYSLSNFERKYFFVRLAYSAKALGVCGRLPRLGLGFVVVAFGALVRADHFGRIRSTHERSREKSQRHGQPEDADESIGTSDTQVESHFPSPILMATGDTRIGTGPIPL